MGLSRNIDIFLRRALPARWYNLIRYINHPDKAFILYGDMMYAEDGLAVTGRGVDFLDDPLFAEAYRIGKAAGSWGVVAGSFDMRWRVYVACWAAHKAAGLKGDFVECGVNRGWLSRSVIHYVDFGRLSKTFYLLDTFEGIYEPYLSETERQRGLTNENFQYTDCYADVVETFKPFPNVKLVRGPVPDTLPLVDTNTVSYLSIDMNNVMPEIAAAEYFWDRLVSGAVMLLDDYGHQNHIEQKVGFDDFAARKRVKVLPLPTGQGLIFKP